MENNKSTQDIEKFVRQELQNIQAEPDGDMWSRIAAQQSPKNIRLRMRYVTRYTLVALSIVLVVLLGWRWLTHVTDNQPFIPPPAKEIPNAGQELVQAGPVISPTEVILNATFKEGTPKTGFALTKLSPMNRPAWYNNNTVPIQQVRFRADKGLQYRSSATGNSVSIPANVLVYADGSPVTGQVDLSFREYRTMADFLAAGMPMHYSDSRGDFFFNSGGMFEVRVRQNGEDLFIAPGKTYNVAFAPTGNLTDANLFSLSDTTDQWSHAHGQPVLEDTIGLAVLLQPRVLSEADVVRDNSKDAALDCLPETATISPDYDPLIWVQDAVTMGRDYAHGKIQPPVWFRRNTAKDDNFFLKNLERSDIRVVHQNDLQERFFPDDLNGVFTELAAFKDCYFSHKPDSMMRPDPANSVIGIFNQNRTWDRVRIIQGIGTACTVVLSDETDEINVAARIARSSELYDGTPFDPDAVFAEYEQLRNLRHENNLATIQRWRHFIQVADMFQTSAEWCMSAAQWFDYFDQNLPLMQARYDALYNTGVTTDKTLVMNILEEWQNKVRKLQYDRLAKVGPVHSAKSALSMSLTLTGFGTHNWDQIFQMASRPEYLFPKYKTADGRHISPIATRIIERSTRLFFSMPYNDKILKLPGRYLDIIVTGSNGRTYYLPAKTYAGLNLKKADAYTFTLEDVTDKVGSPLEWAQLLGI